MGYYFDEWRINYEALKKITKSGPFSSEYIKFSEPDEELNLRVGQVEQDPIFDNYGR